MNEPVLQSVVVPIAFVRQAAPRHRPAHRRAFEHLAMRSKRYIDSGRMDREYGAQRPVTSALRAPGRTKQVRADEQNRNNE